MTAPSIERAKLALTDSPGTAYTVPEGKAAVVRTVVVAALDEDVEVSIWWTDAEDGDAPVRLAPNVTVAGGDPITIAEHLHLKAGDTLKAECDTADGAELTAAILEFDAGEEPA